MKHRSKKVPAFTLLELILSVGLVATCLLIVVGIFAAIISSSQKASDFAGGSLVAESELNRNIYDVVNQEPPYTGQKSTIFATTSRTLLSPPGSYNVTQGRQTYLCNLYVEGVYDPGTSPASPNRLVRFDIEVNWTGDAALQTRAGQGRLTTSLSRFANENSTR